MSEDRHLIVKLDAVRLEGDLATDVALITYQPNTNTVSEQNSPLAASCSSLFGIQHLG
jgi:hypothetical protein